MFVLLRIICGVVILSLLPASGWGREGLSGPVPAEVLRVIDGDSVRVRARIWPGHSVVVTVRLLGIDTPELRAKCPAERMRARAAKAYLASLLKRKTVSLHDIRFGKYAGRVLARMSTRSVSDLSAVMLKSGNARPYAGRKRAGWCAVKPRPQP